MEKVYSIYFIKKKYFINKNYVKQNHLKLF